MKFISLCYFDVSVSACAAGKQCAQSQTEAGFKLEKLI